MNLIESLDRTLRLMRTHLRPDISDQQLAEALIGTKVVLVANAENISSHAAQSAYVTAAILMARMGITVLVDAPDVLLSGPQPPVKSGRLVTNLIEIGEDLLPGSTISRAVALEVVDLAIVLGDTPWPQSTCRVVRINAGDWHGEINRISQRWRHGS